MTAHAKTINNIILQSTPSSETLEFKQFKKNLCKDFSMTYRLFDHIDVSK